MSLHAPLASLTVASLLVASLALPLDLRLGLSFNASRSLTQHPRRDNVLHQPVDHHGDTLVAGSYIFTIFSMIFLVIMGVLFGKRIEHLKITRRQDIQPIRVLVFCIYFAAILMIVGLSIMLQARGLQSPIGCSAGIVVCLVGYVGTKILLYLFLIKRLHAFNYRQPRLKDKTWMGSVAFIVTGFGAIAATAFAFPFSDYNHDTRSCSIGLSTGTLVALLAYDLMINVGLNALFIRCLLGPLRFRYRHTTDQQPSMAHRLTNAATGSPTRPAGSPSDHASAIPQGVVDAKSTKNIERLLYKSLIGLLLLAVPTVINLTVLLYLSGHEKGWLCFTLCLADVTTQIVVVHWMTRTPLDLASKIRIEEPRRPVFEERKTSNESSSLPPSYNPTDPLADSRVP